MKERWLVAVLGIPFILAIFLLCPPWATMLLVCAIAGVAAWELLRVAGNHTEKPVCFTTVFFSAALVAGVYAYALGIVSITVLFGTAWLLVMLLFLTAVLTHGKKNAVPFATVCAAITGGVVFPLMYSCVLLLRMRDQFGFGCFYVLLPFAAAFAGDSLAMYFGMWFGKKKMAPLVSPNKTWAGFCGSLLGSSAGLLLMGWIGSIWLGYVPNYSLLAVAGVVANLAGQLGDLSTSLIKREHGVKDYSHLFLTHGGVLDRFDSTLFIAPVLFFFVNGGLI